LFLSDTGLTLSIGAAVSLCRSAIIKTGKENLPDPMPNTGQARDLAGKALGVKKSFANPS